MKKPVDTDNVGYNFKQSNTVDMLKEPLLYAAFNSKIHKEDISNLHNFLLVHYRKQLLNDKYNMTP